MILVQCTLVFDPQNIEQCFVKQIFTLQGNVQQKNIQRLMDQLLVVSLLIMVNCLSTQLFLDNFFFVLVLTKSLVQQWWLGSLRHEFFIRKILHFLRTVDQIPFWEWYIDRSVVGRLCNYSNSRAPGAKAFTIYTPER